MARIPVLQIVTRLVGRGVPRHVLDIAAGLAPERYAVEILAGRGEPWESSLWEEARERGVPTHYAAGLRRRINPVADVVALVAIYRRIRRGRYRIVHTHISKAGVLGRVAARCARVPVVVHTYHGRVEEIHGGSLGSRVLRWCEGMAAGLTDGLVAVSGDTARLALSSGIGTPRQFAVIHNGIDIASFQGVEAGETLPDAIRGKLLIGAVGSLTREKGFDVLLDSFSRLAGNRPDVHLCLLGDGPLRQSLEAQAGALGVADRVCLPGHVTDVRPWLSAFELMVVPSRSEGLPMVVLEAMASGRAVVATRVGGIPEVVQDGCTGLLVPPENAAALAAAMGDSLGDAARRRGWGQAGLEYVRQEFSLAGMIDKLDRLYQRLLAAREVR